MRHYEIYIPPFLDDYPLSMVVDTHDHEDDTADDAKTASDAPGSTRTLRVERTTSTGHRLMEYDGVCENLHGHNMAWTADLSVRVPEDSQMAIDFKDASDVVDRYDHALLLNETDPLADTLANADAEQNIIRTPGDPTCEFLAQQVAKELCTLENVDGARVTLAETDKYAMTAEHGTPPAPGDM